MDANSPQFLSVLAKGSVIPTVTLSTYSASAGKGTDTSLRSISAEGLPDICLDVLYSQLVLTNVIVSGLSKGGSSGDDRFTESITLNVSH